MGGCQIDLWTTVNQVIKSFGRKQSRNHNEHNFCQSKSWSWSQKLQQATWPPLAMQHSLLSQCTYLSATLGMMYKPSKTRKTLTYTALETVQKEFYNQHLLRVRKAQHNPRIAFHINGDGHQINFKLCYSNFKWTGEIGNHILRKVIMMYSSIQTRSDSVPPGSARNIFCEGKLVHCSHIHVHYRHSLRLASRDNPLW